MAQATARQQLTPNTPNLALRPVLLMSFLWMFGGMIIAAIVAYWAGQANFMTELVPNHTGLVIGGMIAWMVLSITFVPLVKRVPAPIGAILFAIYAAWTGLSLSLAIQEYTEASVIYAFVATVVLFGTMVVFALTTKMDLVKYSFYIFAGIIALLIATLLNLFVFQSSEFDWVLTIVGILLFSISTARGVQRIVRMDQTLDPALRSRLAIIGAMILFTDFVNLFIRILQIVGSKKK